MAMLTPTLAGVRGRSKQTVCLQNLARIAEGSIVYATADPDDQAVPVHKEVVKSYHTGASRREIGRMAWGGKSGRGAEDGNNYFWATPGKKGPATRALNRIIYGDVFPDYEYDPGPGAINWLRDASLDLPVYRCPSDNGYTGDPLSNSWRDSGLTAYDHYGNSYAANVLWIFVVPDTGCGLGGGEPCCESASPFLNRLGDISNPAQTIYYLEACGRFAFIAGPQGLPGDECGSVNPDVVHGWHGQPWQFSAAFVDGSARAVNIRGYKNFRLGHYPECIGWSDCHRYWQCVIIRGDDWQLDTLPLEPIRTTVPCRP
ncbi:MAG: hypothetical protein GY778_05855 [bacterium]|nr:hypothetical protein [bacterium]